MYPESKRAIGLTAYAKINLYLHVTGRRADGYHELDSLIAFAGVGDRVIIEPADDLTFAVTGPYAATVPQGDGNLVLQAAHRLRERANPDTGAEIVLDKHLPVAAGIGGGSADAAAALLGLAKHWRLDLPASELARIGLALGADVPVCLYGRAAFVGGIGEIIEPAPVLPAAWLVLANAGVPVATKDVFAARTGDFTEADPFDAMPDDVPALAALLAERGNDLTEAAVAVAPAITATLAALEACDEVLLARLSGSGATCFALFANEDAARAASQTLKTAHDGWWVEAAPLVADTTVIRD